jgi:ribosomal protein S27E
MPYSEPDIDAMGCALKSLDLAPNGGWASDPAVVVACRWCGYLVRTDRNDQCECGRVVVRPVNGQVTVTADADSSPDVFRLVPAHRAV